jgi:hypothetical protein
MKFMSIGIILVNRYFFFRSSFAYINVRENTFRTEVITNIKVKTKNRIRSTESQKLKTNKQIIYPSL